MSRYARFVGGVSSLHRPSIIREMTKVLASAPKDVIPLSGGLPKSCSTAKLLFVFQRKELCDFFSYYFRTLLRRPKQAKTVARKRVTTFILLTQPDLPNLTRPSVLSKLSWVRFFKADWKSSDCQTSLKIRLTVCRLWISVLSQSREGTGLTGLVSPDWLRIESLDPVPILYFAGTGNIRKKKKEGWGRSSSSTKQRPLKALWCIGNKDAKDLVKS